MRSATGQQAVDALIRRRGEQRIDAPAECRDRSRQASLPPALVAGSGFNCRYRLAQDSAGECAQVQIRAVLDEEENSGRTRGPGLTVYGFEQTPPLPGKDVQLQLEAFEQVGE